MMSDDWIADVFLRLVEETAKSVHLFDHDIVEKELAMRGEIGSDRRWLCPTLSRDGLTHSQRNHHEEMSGHALLHVGLIRSADSLTNRRSGRHYFCP